jgi:antirestriction protein ArdC
VPGAASGYYELDSKEIVVDVLGDDFHPNGQVKTLIHELAHALVRHDHSDEDPDLSYAEEEIVAESVAYCACSSAGLDTSNYSTGYLASWSDSAGSDSIQRYATLIDRLARTIEDVIAAAFPTDDDEAA